MEIPPAVEASSLSKTYKRGRQTIIALQNVSFTIKQGEFIAITGASGSGKSTLLQILGGLDKPTTGHLAVDGTDLSVLSDSALSRFRNLTIGFVFQFFHMQPFLRLDKNIELPGMFLCSNRRLRRQKVLELLQIVGLANRVSHYPKELSGGQIQRAAIARALLNSPKILLADEPTGNLDSQSSREIVTLFQKIRADYNTTIIVVTHNPDIARQADREIILKDGVLT